MAADKPFSLKKKPIQHHILACQRFHSSLTYNKQHCLAWPETNDTNHVSLEISARWDWYTAANLKKHRHPNSILLGAGGQQLFRLSATILISTVCFGHFAENQEHCVTLEQVLAESDAYNSAEVKKVS